MSISKIEKISDFSFLTPFFSIIIPCYNSEKFIQKSIESLFSQTFKQYEVIIVNDGSTDNTAQLIAKLINSDKRYKLYTTAHYGAGHARNTGYKIAKGKYLIFLDSDDFYSPHMLQIVYNTLFTKEVDILVFRSDLYDILSNRYKKCDWTIRKNLLPKKEIFKHSDITLEVFNIFNWWGWDKVYRKEFVDENKLYHQEIMSTNDLYFNITAFVLAEKITIINDILLHHTINIKTSIVNTRYLYYENCLFALYWFYKFLHNKNLYNKLKYEFINYSIHLFLWHLKNFPTGIREKLSIIYKYRYKKFFCFDEYLYNPAINQKELTELLLLINNEQYII